MMTISEPTMPGTGAGPCAPVRHPSEALALAVAGRPAEAVARLGELDPQGWEEAVQALTVGSARVLRRMQRRSQYRIPLAYIVDRIPFPEIADPDPCVDFLIDATSGAVGLRLAPPPEAGSTDQERLIAALLATAGVVRFAAARWWTSVDAVTELLWDAGVPDADQPGSNR